MTCYVVEDPVTKEITTGEIHRGTTDTLNRELATIEVPCGETRTVAFDLAASELDDNILHFIPNADEQGFASETITLACVSETTTSAGSPPTNCTVPSADSWRSTGLDRFESRNAISCS